jgi:hypothetical protein
MFTLEQLQALYRQALDLAETDPVAGYAAGHFAYAIERRVAVLAPISASVN